MPSRTSLLLSHCGIRPEFPEVQPSQGAHISAHVRPELFVFQLLLVLHGHKPVMQRNQQKAAKNLNRVWGVDKLHAACLRFHAFTQASSPSEPLVASQQDENTPDMSHKSPT